MVNALIRDRQSLVKVVLHSDIVQIVIKGFEQRSFDNQTLLEFFLLILKHQKQQNFFSQNFVSQKVGNSMQAIAMEIFQESHSLKVAAMKVIRYCGIKKCKKNNGLKIRLHLKEEHSFCDRLRETLEVSLPLEFFPLVKQITKIMQGVSRKGLNLELMKVAELLLE